MRAAQTAFLIELAAVVVVMLCCFVDPPLTSSVEGPVTYADSIEVNVAGNSIEYLDQPIVLGAGDRVRIEYLDHIHERVVLSVTLAPGTPDSTKYTTHAGQRFDQSQWLSYLALVGLVAGLAVAILAAVRLYASNRQQGAPTGGLTGALAPFSLLGGVPLLAFFIYSLPGNRLVIAAVALVWVLATAGTLFTGLAPRLSGEVHVAVGRQGLAFAGFTTALWILGWIAGFIWVIYQFSTGF